MKEQEATVGGGGLVGGGRGARREGRARGKEDVYSYYLQRVEDNEGTRGY